MNRYRYLVVPFIGQIKGKGTAAEVSKQLQAVIDRHVNEGWELYTVNDIKIEVQPGCFGALRGESVSYVSYDQLIFRKEESK